LVLKNLRSAFSLVEILISVMIISVVIVAIAKIDSQNISMAEYISNRSKAEFENTLFLTKEALKYNKDKKDAYTLLRGFKISKIKSKNYLKSIKRKIYIERAIPIKESIVPIELNVIMLKSKYSARYHRFNQ